MGTTQMAVCGLEKASKGHLAGTSRCVVGSPSGSNSLATGTPSNNSLGPQLPSPPGNGYAPLLKAANVGATLKSCRLPHAQRVRSSRGPSHDANSGRKNLRVLTRSARAQSPTLSRPHKQRQETCEHSGWDALEGSATGYSEWGDLEGSRQQASFGRKASFGREPYQREVPSEREGGASTSGDGRWYGAGSVVRNRECWQWTGEVEDVTAERKRVVSGGAQAFWTGGEDGLQESAGLLPWYSQKDVYDGLLRGGSPSVTSGERLVPSHKDSQYDSDEDDWDDEDGWEELHTAPGPFEGRGRQPPLRTAPSSGVWGGFQGLSARQALRTSWVDDDDDLDEAKADFQVLQGMLRSLRKGGVKKAGKAGPSLPVERLQQRGGGERKRLDVSRLTAASASGVTASRSVGRPDIRPPNFLSDLDTTGTPTSEGCVESPPSLNAVSDTSQAFPELGLSSTSVRVQEIPQHRGPGSHTPGDYAQDSETVHLAAPVQEALVPGTGLPFQGAAIQSLASTVVEPRGVVLESEGSQSPGPVLSAPGVELQSPARVARVPGSAAREREEWVSRGAESAPSCGGEHPSRGGVNVPSEAVQEGEVHWPGASETRDGVQAVGSGVNAPNEVGSGVNAPSKEGGAVKVPSKVGNGVNSPGRSPRAREGALQEVVRRMTEGPAKTGQVAQDRGVDLLEEYSRNWTDRNGSFRGGLVEKRGAWERERRSMEGGAERGAEGGGSGGREKGGVRLDQDVAVAGSVEEQGRRHSEPGGTAERRPLGGALLEMGLRQKEPVSGFPKEVPNKRRASIQEAVPREEALLKARTARSLRKSRPERQDRGPAIEPVDESVVSAVVSSIGALRKLDGGVTYGAVEGVLEPWSGRLSQAGWERVLEVLEGEGDWLGVMAVFGWMVGRHAGFDPEIERALSTSDGKPESGSGAEPGEGAALQSISISGFGSPLEGTNSKVERLLLVSGRGLGGEEGSSNLEPGETGASVSDRAFGSALEGIDSGLGFGEGWRDATGVAISQLENGAHVKGHIESVTFEFDASDLVSGTAVGDVDEKSGARGFWGQIGLDADGLDGAVGDNACSCRLCASSRGSAALADVAGEGGVLGGFSGTEEGIAGVDPDSERVRLERLANPGGLGVRTEPIDPLRKRRNRKRSLLSTPVCTTAVRVLGAAGCLPGVLGFLPLLDGTTAGHRLRKALITHLAREGRAEEALSLLLSTTRGQREILLYNVVMDACSKAWLGHERVVALFDLMALDGLEPSVRSFNIVLSALVRENMLVEASRWMDEMRVRGCKPDAVSYNTLLGARVQYKVARGIFDQMLREGVSPNLRTFNVLIAALAAIGDYAEAKTWVHRMKGMGVEPSQVTFNSLMTACLNGGSGLDEALCVLDDMEAAGFSSDVVTFNILIGACSRYGWLEEREDLLVDMKAAGIEPNDITYKMLALHRPDDQERGFRKRLEVYPVQVQAKDGVVKRRRKRSH